MTSSSRRRIGRARADAPLARLAREIARCRLCPRLVEHRENAAAAPPKRFRGQRYWARPVPGFGDPAARLVVVGLAPAAHGANRTGRMFTGDRSGDWLYAALHRAGFASHPSSTAADDGLDLRDVWVTAVVRCAPPENRPATEERDRCLPFLENEIAALENARVFVALGGFAFENVLRSIGRPRERSGPRPRFGHGVEVALDGDRILLASYHPSQQNTFTGRLTRPMLDQVFEAARGRLAGSGP